MLGDQKEPNVEWHCEVGWGRKGNGSQVREIGEALRGHIL